MGQHHYSLLETLVYTKAILPEQIYYQSGIPEDTQAWASFSTHCIYGHHVILAYWLYLTFFFFWKASWLLSIKMCSSACLLVYSSTSWSASIHYCCCSSAVACNMLVLTSSCCLLLHWAASQLPAGITAWGECHSGGNNLGKSMDCFLKCQSDFEQRAIWISQSRLHSKVWIQGQTF